MYRLHLLSRVGALLTILAAGAVGLGIFGFNKVSASVITDCSNNSIIQCGEQNPSDFISAVQSGDNGRYTELPEVYSNFGLVPGQYDQFVSSAEDGVAYQNGTIVVNGQIVATDAWSIGRSHFSYATPYVIDDHTYYRAADSQVLLQNLPVMVMFNARGQMMFAVMKACGNPVTGKIVTPQYSCNLLQVSPVSGQANTYSFMTSAAAGANASVDKVVYDFGDGSSTVAASSLNTPVQHTYTRPGNWVARVTVYVSLPGSQDVTVTSANCQHLINVAVPYQQCLSLNSAVTDEEQRKVQFTISTNQGNGAILKDATFNFGDESTPEDETATSPNSIIVNYTYASYGTYEASATVNFSTMTGDQSVSCMTSVTLTAPPTPPPSVTPPPAKPAAKVLVNTGPGSVLGLFIGTSVIGYLGYRFVLSKRLGKDIK